jgi:hypothetical protein
MAESAPVSTPTPIETETAANGTPALLAPNHPAAPVPEPSPTPQPAATPAPAELVPQPGLRERVAWYAGAAALTAVLIAAGLRLDAADITAPFYYDEDALLILPLVKATLERGSHWRNERMGYPGIQELHDYPVVDHLHFLLIWLLGRVFSNPVVVFNLYYLLTYPLTAFTAMYAFRRVGLTLPAAAVGAVLYAFLPYHYLRGEHHYFLAAYWLVPLTMLPVLALMRGELSFFGRGPDGRRVLRPWSRESLGLVVLGAATASGGAYYAFFACALYAAAGLYAWAAHRTWRAAASAALLVGVVFVVGVVNHLPTIAYQAKWGRNPVTDRIPEEAEIYGVKIAHLVLPINDHNLTVLARIKSAYNSGYRPVQNENERAALGVVGSAGLLGLLAVLLWPGPRAWPYGPLAVLTAFMLLLATVGGFGAVFNHLVFDQVRCYNRISVYLAFVCLLAAMWWLDGFLLRRTGRARRLRLPALAAVLAVGFLDQTPHSFFRDEFVVESMAAQAERFRTDAQFFARIEESMDPGSRVFSLPFMPFPEYPEQEKMFTYEPARGYLHTRTLVWGYGAMKGREADAWQREVIADAVPGRPGAVREFVRRIVARGFDGLFIDTRGYPVVKGENLGHILVQNVEYVCTEIPGGQKPREIVRVEGRDHDQVFVDLRRFRDTWRAIGEAEYERYVREEREYMAVTWLKGIHPHGTPGDDNRVRWCTRSGLAVVNNPTDRTRTVRIAMRFGTDFKGVYHITVSGLIQDELDVEKGLSSVVKDSGVPRAYTVEVPPGRHEIRFKCVPPPDFMPVDSQYDLFFIQNFLLREVK